jgi:putative addiction module component (TIGR02574 family)
MLKEELRERLHEYIDRADIKEVKAIYKVLEEKIEKEMVEEYSSAFKTELDNRVADYKSGKSKVISLSESKKRINTIIKSKLK